MEEAGPAIAHQPRGEDVEQVALDIAGIMIRADTDEKPDVERHEARRDDFEVVTREAIAGEMIAQRAFERLVDRAAAAAVDREEDGVPTAGPAPFAIGTLNIGVRFRRRDIVGGGDGAALFAKVLRSGDADRGGGFGVAAADTRQGIANARDCA